MTVDFALSDDQQAIHDVFDAFFARESPLEVVRAAEAAGGHDADLWQRLGAMDAPGMAGPTANGGGGASWSQLIVVAEALGAALAPVPLIEHWAASTLIPDPDLVAGGHIGTLALHAADERGMWRLVPAGAVAHMVVGVDGDHAVVVRSAPPDNPPATHAGAPLATRSAKGPEREIIGPAAAVAHAADMWRVLTAAALVGLAQRALDIGVDYVLERQQFGRRIGSFQAIQHGLADCPALIDGARFLAHKAAWAADSGLADGAGTIDVDEGVITELAPLASMALLQAAEAAAVTTDRSLHYHGGYGFSLEYDIQLYFRRARGWALVAGDPATERARLADLLWGSA